jgi:phage terminase large subunit-like protein
MNMEHWKACGCKKTLEDMRGQKCFVGLDLSSGGDLTSIDFEFPRIEIINSEEIKKYFIHSHSFMPAKRLEEHMQTDKFDYKQAIARGELTLTETNGGIKTDYKYILAYIKEQKELYDLQIEAFAYDPHNADAFLSDLCEIFGVENTIDAIEIVQSARNLNSATVDFALECEAGNIEYNEDDKLLTHCMANARTTSNSFKEIKLDKNTAGAKIDPIAAIMDSHHIARYYEPVINIYETRGMRIL